MLVRVGPLGTGTCALLIENVKPAPAGTIQDELHYWLVDADRVPPSWTSERGGHQVTNLALRSQVQVTAPLQW